jgi:VIT1/CCC1 family predicted Fe2+/Mn2+ transporter
MSGLESDERVRTFDVDPNMPSRRARAQQELAAMKAEHEDTSRGGRMRAAVFGLNDGLVTNASLVVGVAAANTGKASVILAGVAGLVAGAVSMAAGEYISVGTQRELFESRLEAERRQLRERPEAERREATIIFRAKGVPAEDAERLADQVMADPEVALDLMAREELGLIPEDLGSPITVALSSFISFSIGAALPLLPFLMLDGTAAMICALILAAAALAALGAITARLSGRSVMRGIMRAVAIGALGTGVTYLIGRAIGSVIQ